MNWFILTLLAITTRSIYSIFTKILSKDVKVSAITQSLLLTTSAGIISIFILPFFGGVSFAGIEKYWPQVVVMVLAQAFANILYFKGIKKLDAGMTQIAFSSILIWGAVLSMIFLDSSFSLTQIAGMVLMLMAILLVQYKKGKMSLNINMVYVILSAMLFALFQVASADLSRTISTGAYLLMVYFGSSIVISLLYFKMIKKDLVILKKQVKTTFYKTFMVSFTSVLYFIFSYLSFQHAPDRGVVIVLLTAQVTLSIVFGIIFLKEKDNKTKKLIAGGLAFVAGFLMKG